MKKAFTLVEMLVVIGIIGILAGVLIASFSGGTESARAAKCLTNMKSLASACQTYGLTSGQYPLAGSVEKVGLDQSQGFSNVKMAYTEMPGWISWNSRGSYPVNPKPTSHVSSISFFQSAYNQDRESREYCLTNGVLWKHISGNREVYVCPCHRIKFKRNLPAWSYVMNCEFRWDDSKGSRAQPNSFWGIEYGKLSRADRRLLFAELPYMGVERESDTSSDSGTKNDCTLQYEPGHGGECIGFNHKSGKRGWVAHVVFADGHVEKLTWPKDGLGESELRELTEWYCKGIDVSFNGKKYEKMTQD